MSMIARLYQTHTQAQGAYDALQSSGFGGDAAMIAGVSRAAAGDPAAGAPAAEADAGAAIVPPEADTITAIRAGSLLGEHAAFYAEQLTEGNSLVVVSPPFGSSRKAIAILDDYNPLPISHEPPPEPYVPFTERSTPLSSLLGLPVLSKTATPCSDFWGFDTLQEGTSHFSRWLSPLAPGFMFSSLIGMKLLSGNATPVSSMTGMSTQSSRLAGKSSSFGLPLKASNTTPLSSLFGIPVLSKRKRFLTQ
jgi:hypothetical protein